MTLPQAIAIALHANLAPSAAHRWMRCFASTRMEAGLPGSSSEYAEEGTRAHAFGASELTGGTAKADDDEMRDAIASYVERVNAAASQGRETPLPILVEQRVDMQELVPECWGTSDIIMIADDELIVRDLKYGMGERVDAEENEQGQLYALGAFLANKAHHDYVTPFERARIIIDQPRLNHLSEWVISIDDLLKFASRAARAAEMNIFYRDECMTREDIPPKEFNPGVKQCRWCKAYSLCPAVTEKVHAALAAEMAPIPDEGNGSLHAVPMVYGPRHEPVPLEPAGSVLSRAMDQVEFAENWVKAVRAAVFTELQHGRDVPGYKLVQGRKGNRAWVDEAAVDKMLKGARLKQAQRYTFQLISPTQAEKLLLKSNPRVWAKAQPLITRADGSLSVAAVDDERPAYSVLAEIDALPELDASPYA